MNTLEEIKRKREELIEIGKTIYPSSDVGTRTIEDVDVDILNELIKKYNPSIIFEIGSWIGTSAMVMEKSSDKAKVFTCDNNNVFVYKSQDVSYYNCSGKSFLKLMISKDIRADIIFVDAGIKEDMKYVLRAMMPNFVFIAHDFVKGSKGMKNMIALHKKIGVTEVIKPREDSTIAYTEVKRG